MSCASETLSRFGPPSHTPSWTPEPTHQTSALPLSPAAEIPLSTTMKKVPCFRILPLAGCLGVLALLAGCFENRQEFTLNPDGSGKVVHESKLQTMDLSGGKPGSEKQLKAAVAEIIGKA